LRSVVSTSHLRDKVPAVLLYLGITCYFRPPIFNPRCVNSQHDHFQLPLLFGVCVPLIHFVPHVPFFGTHNIGMGGLGTERMRLTHAFSRDAAYRLANRNIPVVQLPRFDLEHQLSFVILNLPTYNGAIPDKVSRFILDH